MENNQTERITIENRKRLSMTGVVAVNGFTEQAVKLSLNGAMMVINGKGIKITAFNKETGNLSCEGTITEIKYAEKKGNIVKRLFK
ncbi:MAG: hypothetical protein IJR66_01900 [Clostridia bacterium]|nr:hypothetical protein [Clostridia bacterium]